MYLGHLCVGGLWLQVVEIPTQNNAHLWAPPNGVYIPKAYTKQVTGVRGEKSRHLVVFFSSSSFILYSSRMYK